MKAKRLLNKSFFLLTVLGLIGLSASSVFSQQVKKKIVRVVEIDDKGERVVKEFNVTNDAAKYDSITRDIRSKIKIEKSKMDSLKHALMISFPSHPEFPQMPEMPDIPDFDFHIEAPDAPFFEFGNDGNFDFFTPDLEGSSAKIYYSEKNLDKGDNLDKILEDLENGTFDPQKWNMKELEKDKIKDFKTNGKGEVIVFNNQLNPPHRIKWCNPNPHKNAPRNHIEARMLRNGHHMIYVDADSIKKNFETYTFSSGDSDEVGWSMIDMKRNGEDKHHGNGHHIEFYNFDSDKDSTEDVFPKSFTFESSDDFDGPNSERLIVVGPDDNKSKKAWIPYEGGERRTIITTNNDNITKFDYLKPSAEELSMLEKSGFLKPDGSKLLNSESIILIPRKEQGKYNLLFKEEELGKVKVLVANDKGSVIKTEEFEHSKVKTEKEVEIKDLKSGVYFIQAQMNGKTTTSKLKIIQK